MGQEERKDRRTYPIIPNCYTYIVKTKYSFKKTPEGKYKVVKREEKTEKEQTDDNIANIIKDRISKEKYGK